MIKIWVVDGMVECPDCNGYLHATVEVRATDIALRYDKEKMVFTTGDMFTITQKKLVDIFCEDCGFVLTREQLQDVIVEVWSDDFHKMEMAERMAAALDALESLREISDD